MERLQWMTLWDKLRDQLEDEGELVYPMSYVLGLMDQLEKEEARRVERENQFEKDEE